MVGAVPVFDPLNGAMYLYTPTATTDVSVNSWNIDACEQLKPKKRQLRVLQEEDCPLGLPDRRTGIQPRLGSKECNDVLHETCYYEFEKNEKIW